MTVIFSQQPWPHCPFWGPNISSPDVLFQGYQVQIRVSWVAKGSNSRKGRAALEPKISTKMSCNNVMMFSFKEVFITCRSSKGIQCTCVSFMCSVSWAIPRWRCFKTATVNKQLFFESLSFIIIIKVCTFPFIHLQKISFLKTYTAIYSIHQPLPNSHHLCSSKLHLLGKFECSLPGMASLISPPKPPCFVTRWNTRFLFIANPDTQCMVYLPTFG